MAKGSISSFLSSFTEELARPNHFDVTIKMPTALSGADDFAKYELTYRCESTELPGRSLQTSGMKVYGVEEKFPYLTSYSDINLTFIVSDKMTEKTVFDRWINYIHPTATYNFKYKEDYATDLVITQYNLKKEPSYKVKLLQAYPIAVNGLDLNWGADGYHKLTVTFAFTSWEEVVDESTVNRVQYEINEQNAIVQRNVRTTTSFRGDTFSGSLENPDTVRTIY
jgi:hypothetical protein